MGNKGFTLLELLLSLTIMALIVAICFGAFHAGIRSWEKGEEKVVENQRLRIIPDLIKRQLASLTRPDVLKKDRQRFYFAGTEKTVEFFSRISLYPRDDGIFYVQYRVLPLPGMTENLNFYEHDILTLHNVNRDALGNELFLPLAKGYESVTFTFLARTAGPQGENIWLSDWNQKLQRGLPRAVRISMVKDHSDPPIEIIVPLAAGNDD